MQIFFKVVGIILMAFLSTLPAWAQEDSSKVRFKRYEIKRYTWKDQALGQVFQSGKKVFEVEAKRGSYLQFVAIDGQPTLDINQDSTHNFIFQVYSGTEEDCSTWYILHLGSTEFKEVDRIQTCYDIPWLVDYEQDGIYEIVLKDYTFANWNASFLDSPYEIVSLRYQEGKYRLALDLMAKAPPTDLEMTAREIKQALQKFYQKSKETYPYEVNVLEGRPEERWSFIPAKLWKKLLALYYSGNADKASDFLHSAWYKELEGKEDFWKDFLQKLQNSPYWKDLERLNQGNWKKP